MTNIRSGEPRIYAIPKWLEKLPWFSRVGGLAIYPVIFLRREYYDDFKSGKQSHKTVALIMHESEHLKRMKEMGLVKFGIGYLMSGRFRFNEELIATKASMPYMKKNKVDPIIGKRAKILSSWFYLWSVPFEFAKEKLEQAWKDA